MANKATFDEPIHNHTARFTFVWEEVMLPVAYRDDWRHADAIMLEEAEAIDVFEDASAALRSMGERYPIAKTDVRPRDRAEAAATTRSHHRHHP